MTSTRFDAEASARQCYDRYRDNAGHHHCPAWEAIPADDRARMIADARHWYQEGYATGRRIYADDDHAALSYGQARYRQRGELPCGAYERGIADALAARLAGKTNQEAA